MSKDPRFMAEEERKSLLKKLKEIDPRLVKHLEEEVVDPYRTTLLRLKCANYKGSSMDGGHHDRGADR
jgi:hypothetical protein